MNRLLRASVRALKGARGDAKKLTAAIGAYLEKGDELGCSPTELWDYFAISSPSLPEKAGFDANATERVTELFERITKKRYRQ